MRINTRQLKSRIVFRLVLFTIQYMQ